MVAQFGEKNSNLLRNLRFEKISALVAPRPGLSATPQFRDIMSRNRFQSILRYLHCNDNLTAVPRGNPGYDPLHKVSPVIDFFNETFHNNYRYMLAVDLL